MRLCTLANQHPNCTVVGSRTGSAAGIVCRLPKTSEGEYRIAISAVPGRVRYDYVLRAIVEVVAMVRKVLENRVAIIDCARVNPGYANITRRACLGSRRIRDGRPARHSRDPKRHDRKHVPNSTSHAHLVSQSDAASEASGSAEVKVLSGGR